MPAFAAAALSVALPIGRLVGLAKKRWRDDDASRLDLETVRRIRAEVDAAFDRLEMIVDVGRDEEVDGAALDAYARHGLVGLVALGLVEEACEVAEPVSEVASGIRGTEEARRDIENETADLRTYLHLADDAFGIDPVGSGQRKWEEFLTRLPDGGRAALVPKRLDDAQIAASMRSLAATLKPTSGRG
jgi:NTP pyrophosphatase (non-canonical NTP hydrolase)